MSGRHSAKELGFGRPSCHFESHVLRLHPTCDKFSYTLLPLQLWSFERFPIGRPAVDFHTPYNESEHHGDLIDAPTFGTMWTRRKVQYASQQVKNCYPAFTAQFDTLHPGKVIWEPYTEEAVLARAPRGISILCTRDKHYWMTIGKASIRCHRGGDSRSPSDAAVWQMPSVSSPTKRSQSTSHPQVQPQRWK